jgi:predicted component of type VI protein secretion system
MGVSLSFYLYSQHITRAGLYHIYIMKCNTQTLFMVGWGLASSQINAGRICGKIAGSPALLSA